MTVAVPDTDSICDSGGEMSGLRSPIGLVAGNGRFPIEFARSAQKQGLKVVALAHYGETDPDLENHVDECLWIKVGQLGSIIRTFKNRGVNQASFVGGIRKIKLFGGVRFDLKGIALLSRLRTAQDDVVLRGVAEELERSGIEIFSPSLLLAESVPIAGVLTARTLTPAECEDARLGWGAARALGRLDIGQTVVVNQRVVVAVEAVEGTDSAIARAGELSGRGGVVVKLAKPQQDLRLDLPAVGAGTIRSMAKAGATALVLEEERALMLDPPGIVAEANSSDIAIVVVRDIEDLFRNHKKPFKK